MSTIGRGPVGSVLGNPAAPVPAVEQNESWVAGNSDRLPIDRPGRDWRRDCPSLNPWSGLADVHGMCSPQFRASQPTPMGGTFHSHPPGFLESSDRLSPIPLPAQKPS